MPAKPAGPFRSRFPGPGQPFGPGPGITILTPAQQSTAGGSQKGQGLVNFILTDARSLTFGISADQNKRLLLMLLLLMLLVGLLLLHRSHSRYYVATRPVPNKAMPISFPLPDRNG